MDLSNAPDTDASSLELPPTISSALPPSSHDNSPGPPHSRARSILRYKGRIVAAVAIVALLGALGGVLATSHPTSKQQTTKTVVVNTQTLDNGTLNKVTSQLGNGGQVQQQLTITPNTLFHSDVVVQGASTFQKDITVDGNVSARGSTNLAGTVNTGGALSVGGTMVVRSSASIGGNLSVSGQITAASLSVGSITLSTLNLSGNLSLEGHIVPLGTRPSVKGSAAIAGGTVAIDGNDTAGTVIITTGNGALLAGEMAIITFNKPFNLTPRVQLTPVDGNAANLRYYVSQSPTFFTVHTATIPSANTTYNFNYFVTD